MQQQVRKFSTRLPKKYDFLHKEPQQARNGKVFRTAAIYPAKTFDVASFPFQMPVDIYQHDAPGELYELPGGKVWGNTGTVLTDDNIMMADVSNEYVNHPSNHSLFRQWKWKKPVIRKGKIAVIATTGATVYYHWLLQHLPRIHLLQCTGALNDIDGFIVNYTGLPFQSDTLQAVGLPMEKIIRSNTRDFFVQAGSLVVPSLPFHPFSFDNVSSWACQFLRNTFLENDREPAARQHFYISRGKSQGRRLVNEQALLPLLKDAGFQIIELDHLSVREQAQLFSQAKMIIAPHGGALANMVFCNPQTKVVDILNEKWINPCFWDLANKLEIDYHPYIARSVEPHQSKDIKHYDSAIDIDDFTTFMKKLMSA